MAEMAENLSGKGKRVVNKTELFRRGPSYFSGSAKRLWEEILEKKARRDKEQQEPDFNPFEKKLRRLEFYTIAFDEPNYISE